MAGIGFELKRALKDDRLLSIAKVYGYSALLSSGPWVISIIAILLVGFLDIITMKLNGKIIQYQIVVTYAIALASSMVVTGFLQLAYTRYVADEIYARRDYELLPSYFGVLLVSWVVGFIFIVPLALFVFPNQSNFFLIGSISTFLVLSGVWISNILAASLKYYKSVLAAFVISYGVIIILSIFYGTSIDGLVFIFFIGNSILFLILMSLIIKSYDSSYLISFKFFNRKKFYWSLGFSGLFYNLGVWADKFVFWYHPLTGQVILGKLHASIVYDLPVFLAYLSILPGMAIMFYRLEADFSEKYELYFDAVTNGGRLDTIRRYKKEMTQTVRLTIRDIIIVQAIINLILFLMADKIFKGLNIPLLYIGLFHILTIGAQLQLGFLSILAILYYIDRRIPAMWLSLAFLILNGGLTLLTIYLGPYSYGYGYTISLLIVFIAGLVIVRKKFLDFDYETFMLR
jgi:uncharacterized membrane protein